MKHICLTITFKIEDKEEAEMQLWLIKLANRLQAELIFHDWRIFVKDDLTIGRD